MGGCDEAFVGIDAGRGRNAIAIADGGRGGEVRYLGLVPSERSTGDSVRRGGIAKAGNRRVRHLLVESAWTDRHPPRIGKRKLYVLEEVPPRVREIAWRAQTRLTARYRALAARGKRTTVVCAAVARELVGFMWSVAKEARLA